MGKVISFLFGGDIWSLLIKWGAILILGWALGKSFGIIQSPIILEMIPYIGGGLGLLGVGIKLGRMFEKIENIEGSLNYLKADFGEVKNKVDVHETKIGELEKISSK